MIEIRYKCICSEEVSLEVLPRRADEEIVDWMSLCVQPALYLDHRRRHPDCKAEALEYAKLPIPAGDHRIGDQDSVN